MAGRTRTKGKTQIDAEPRCSTLDPVTGSGQLVVSGLKEIAIDKDPDGRLSRQFESWGIYRDKVVELAELAADKDDKVQAWVTELNCYPGRPLEWYCRRVGLPVTAFLGHILREWENEKVTQARANVIKGLPDVAEQMIVHSNLPTNAVDRANAMKIGGLLKEGGGVSVNVNTQVNTAIINGPNPDEGILRRFDILKET